MLLVCMGLSYCATCMYGFVLLWYLYVWFCVTVLLVCMALCDCGPLCMGLCKCATCKYGSELLCYLYVWFCVIVVLYVWVCVTVLLVCIGLSYCGTCMYGSELLCYLYVWFCVTVVLVCMVLCDCGPLYMGLFNFATAAVFIFNIFLLTTGKPYINNSSPILR